MLLCLLLYLFLSGASLDAGMVMFLVLVFSIICMATERGQSKAWQIVGFVLLTMPTLVLLTVLFVRFGGYDIDSDRFVREKITPKIQALYTARSKFLGLTVDLLQWEHSFIFQLASV